MLTKNVIVTKLYGGGVGETSLLECYSVAINVTGKVIPLSLSS